MYDEPTTTDDTPTAQPIEKGKVGKLKFKDKVTKHGYESKGREKRDSGVRNKGRPRHQQRSSYQQLNKEDDETQRGKLDVLDKSFLKSSNGTVVPGVMGKQVIRNGVKMTMAYLYFREFLLEFFLPSKI